MSPSYGFHDADVVEFSQTGDTLRLVLTCFTDMEDVTIPVSLTFTGVSGLTINGRSGEPVRKITSEGSVIGLTMANEKAEFAIEWFDDRDQENWKTILYRFTCNKVVTEVGH